MTTSSRPPTPQALFSRIAPWYDLVNVIVSAGYDGLWRRKTTELISLQGVQHILDLACGTGAMGAALRHRFRAADIVGLDVNQAMLEVARKRKGKFYDRLMRGTLTLSHLATPNLMRS